MVADASNRAEANCERKQQRVVVQVETGEFHTFPDALRFALAVKFTGLELAAASSSKNAGEFLKRNTLDVFLAGWGVQYDFIQEGMTLLNLFDADFSGSDFRAQQASPHDLSDGTVGAWLPTRALFRGRGWLLRGAGD
jgi:beta-phosphoglucomutase